MTKLTVIKRLTKALGREAVKARGKGRARYEFTNFGPAEHQLVTEALGVPPEALTDYRDPRVQCFAYTRWDVGNGTLAGVRVYTHATSLHIF